MNAATRMNRLAHRMVTVVIGLCLLGGATTAWARSETLRWRHDPYQQQGVVGFEALVGPAAGAVARIESLGLPQPDGQGVFSASLSVDDAETVFIAIRAIGATGVRSQPSIWQERVGSAGSGSGSSGGGGGSTGGGGATAVDLPAGQPIAPDPIAQLRIDFTGASLSQWLATGARNSLAAQAGLFSLSAVDGDAALTTASSEQNIHAHYTGPGSANLSNIMLTGRMASTMGSAGFGVTSYSQYPDADVYYRLRTMGQGEVFELASHPNASLDCPAASTGVIAQPGVWYRFELSVESRATENLVSARVWRENESRPGVAQAVCSDTRSVRPSSGKIGVWSMGAGERFWDDLQVIPIGSSGGGSTAPPMPPTLIDISPLN